MIPHTAADRAVLARDTPALAWCWRILLPNATEYRLTTHDQYVSARAIQLYSPAPGMEQFANRRQSGMNSRQTEVRGLFSASSGLPFSVFKGGWIWSALGVQTVLNWEFPFWGNNLIGNLYDVDDVEYDERQWRVQFKSLTGRLQQNRGDIFTRLCSNELGLNDGVHSICKAAITNHPQTVTGATVINTPTRRSMVLYKTGGTGFDNTGTHVASYFSHGWIGWIAGNNAGLTEKIEQSAPGATGQQAVELQRSMPYDVVAGDTAVVVVGCDKERDTCKTKFNRLADSFRGFPDIPGLEAVIRNPSAS